MMFATGTVNPVTVSGDAWENAILTFVGVMSFLPMLIDHQ